jgi:hypothetical protein
LLRNSFYCKEAIFRAAENNKKETVMIKKRLIPLLLVTLLCVAGFPAAAFAADTSKGPSQGVPSQEAALEAGFGENGWIELEKGKTRDVTFFIDSYDLTFNNKNPGFPISWNITSSNEDIFTVVGGANSGTSIDRINGVVQLYGVSGGMAVLEIVVTLDYGFGADPNRTLDLMQGTTVVLNENSGVPSRPITVDIQADDPSDKTIGFDDDYIQRFSYGASSPTYGPVPESLGFIMDAVSSDPGIVEVVKHGDPVVYGADRAWFSLRPISAGEATIRLTATPIKDEETYTCGGGFIVSINSAEIKVTVNPKGEIVKDPSPAVYMAARDALKDRVYGFGDVFAFGPEGTVLFNKLAYLEAIIHEYDALDSEIAVVEYKIHIEALISEIEKDLNNVVIDSRADQKLTVAPYYNKTVGNAAFKTNVKLTEGKGKLSYQSSDENVATVSSSGKVTLTGPGRAIITITAAETDQYKSAQIQTTVTAAPKAVSGISVKTAKGGLATISWKADTKSSGYEIQFTTDLFFKKNISSSLNLGGSENSLNVNSLKKGSIYFVKVRPYINLDGEIIYGPYNLLPHLFIAK